jgi:hypothetical protein
MRLVLTRSAACSIPAPGGFVVLAEAPSKRSEITRDYPGRLATASVSAGHLDGGMDTGGHPRVRARKEEAK